MMISWPNKTASEVKDYSIDWFEELGADTITSSTWTVPSGITQNSATATETVVTIWLSGGTAGQSYEIRNVIVTDDGRTYERSASIFIEGRIALVVETGAGLANADSYASVSEFKAYCSKRGLAFDGYGDDDIEAALRKATVWIDAKYRDQFQGTWTVSTQALEWPRSGALYRRTAVDAYSVPVLLKNALCEAAWREMTVSGGLTPDQFGDQIKRDKVGDVETEFRAGAVNARPWVPVIDDILSGLLKGSATAYVGKAVRA